MKATTKIIVTEPGSDIIFEGLRACLKYCIKKGKSLKDGFKISF